MSNLGLNNASKQKNDEFYTLYEDIEKEMNNWKDQLIGKRIHLFADTLDSQFWIYFFNNFKRLQLTELVATSLSKKMYKTIDGINIEEIDLQNGDCLSNEILNVMRAHLCITNPPFSIEGEILSTLVENNIEFLIIGPETLCHRKNLFNYFKEGQIKFGYNSVKKFKTEEGYQTFGNVTWLTNLNKPDNLPLPLTKQYSPNLHLKADNYDCINVDKLVDIPYDYNGVMAVPITYLKKHCSKQFNIIGTTHKGLQGIPQLEGAKGIKLFVNGKEKFQRIFIQKL